MTTALSAMFTTTILAASAAMMASTAMGAQFVQYTPGGDDTAVERMDSIISPGTISAHTHQIFGASNMSPDMSYDDLQNSDCSTVGNAEGEGNGADKSVYWHPALFAEAADDSGYIRIPTSGHKLYYKDIGANEQEKRSPFEFPKGFRMVAGDPFLRAAAEGQRQNITQWICHGSSSSNQGTDGGFPTGVSDCDAYPGFNGAIHFPHCWNGKDFDQSRPTAHISYPEGDVQNGACPSSHPTRLPHIFAENQFDVHKVVDQIKPNTFVLAQGDPTGYGWHADFVNGWDEGAIPALMEQCPQPYYGNEDIGSCPNMKKFSTKTADCKLKVSYEENVTNPGKYLPGCNPIQTQNPATKFAVADLGISTDDCSAASSSSGSGYISPSAGNDTSSSHDDVSSSSSTTLATSVRSSTASAVTTISTSGADHLVAYVTHVVTVTADHSKREPTPEARHEHLMDHRNAHRHVRNKL